MCVYLNLSQGREWLERGSVAKYSRQARGRGAGGGKIKYKRDPSYRKTRHHTVPNFGEKPGQGTAAGSPDDTQSSATPYHMALTSLAFRLQPVRHPCPYC